MKPTADPLNTIKYKTADVVIFGVIFPLAVPWRTSGCCFIVANEHDSLAKSGGVDVMLVAERL